MKKFEYYILDFDMSFRTLDDLQGEMDRLGMIGYKAIKINDSLHKRIVVYFIKESS